METIAFYSYKGGVGRSLLVANAARFLGMLGKRVVALDLDLEAPGLHYKLGRAPSANSKPTIAGGAVPYLVAALKGEKPSLLKEHTIELPLPESSGGSLRLMPAGPAPRREYWADLKTLREKLRLDDPSGMGVAALLDLHSHIEEELKPDYLLIDARTGVTEIGGLATTALADCVVCMTVLNQESLEGTIAIMESLTSSKQSAVGKLRVVPVLTRTTEASDNQDEISETLKRLAIFDSVQINSKTKEVSPITLPHDSVLGANDRVVGGEQKASTFSPLHKAYLELFQSLFPQAKTRAEDVLRQMESVSEVKARITKSRRRRDGYTDSFEPWESSSIQEGVIFKDGKNKQGKFVDLVCTSENGKPLMIVEYISKEPTTEALEFWRQHRSIRYLILISSANSDSQQSAYCRADGWDKFEPSQRYEIPAPIEFEIFENPGIRTVEQLLEALHRGSGEIVPELISEWRELSAFGGFPFKRRGRWRPVEARKILDGLAATEKFEIAAKILRRASGSDWHRRRRSDFDEFEQSRTTEEDLFAPLFWRLPVESAVRYLSEAEHPGWMPCFAGSQLLAGVMGLQYDPMREALMENDTLAVRLVGDTDDRLDEEWLFHRMRHRFHRGESICLSENTPPCLLWEQQLREDRYWSGDKDRITEKATKSAQELLADGGRLRSWLRGTINKNALVTSGIMGGYDSHLGRIELFPRVLEALAPLLKIQPRYLKSVVFIQLSAFAVAHQSYDCDGQLGYGFALPNPHDPFQRENPTPIILSQYFTFRLIERLGDSNLMSAFEKLSEKQPEHYRRWQEMRKVPIEQMRSTLLKARHNPSALDLY